LPPADFNFDDLSIFKSGLYFLDIKSSKIIKYAYFGDLNWDNPVFWLDPSTENVNAKSIIVDGSVWILDGENSIKRYYAGTLQETLDLKIFPYPKNFSKIFTAPALPYLYILEPDQKRIIIINRSGKIIKQFQSEKFDNLTDFTVSSNGKIIYLLNGMKVYQIKL
jgi:hypothetical protein